MGDNKSCTFLVVEEVGDLHKDKPEMSSEPFQSFDHLSSAQEEIAKLGDDVKYLKEQEREQNAKSFATVFPDEKMTGMSLSIYYERTN